MFGNMEVATRLVPDFGIVIALLLTVSVLSMTKLGTLNETMDLMLTDRVVNVRVTKDMARNTVDNGRQVRNILLATNDADIAMYKEAVATNRKLNSEAMATLEKLVATETGKRCLGVIVSTRATLSDKYEPFYALAKVATSASHLLLPPAQQRLGYGTVASSDCPVVAGTQCGRIRQSRPQRRTLPASEMEVT